MNRNKKGQKALDEFLKSHKMVLENVVGEYLVDRHKIKFDVNEKLIVLNAYYDVYQNIETKEWAAMPLL